MTGYVRSREVLWRSTPVGIVILPIGQTRPLTLTASGISLWTLLARPRSVPQLAEDLAARYNASAEHIAADIVGVLDELCQLRAIDEVKLDGS